LAEAVGVARIFFWGCTFSSKVGDLILVVILNNTQAKTAKLTTSTLQTSPAQQKFPQKIDLLLCLGGALTPINYAQHFFLALEVQCTPWLRLWRRHTFGRFVVVSNYMKFG